MRYSESENEWLDYIPKWVIYLMRLGYTFAEKAKERRISLISMPCDSQGAGLVALGAMRFYLSEEPFSDDDIIKRIEQKKLRTIIHPRGKFQYQQNIDGRVEIREEIPPDARRSLQQPRTPLTVITSVQSLRFYDEPFFKVSAVNGLQYLSIYEVLLESARTVRKENLQQSSSLVCLAGKKRGMNITRDLLARTMFRHDSQEINLDQLLSLIVGQQFDTVSRVTAYNTRTGTIDWRGLPPEIVVADGIDAFLKVLEESRTTGNQFYGCSLVAVIDRAEKRDKLEVLRQAMSDLLHWYQDDSRNLPKEVHEPPAGIGVASYVIRRRGL